MKKKLLIIAALSLASSVFAADFKLGYVDVAKIFTTTKQAQALQSALMAKFDGEQKSLKALNDNLVSQNKQINDVENKAGSPDKLSAADKAKLTKMLKQYQQDQMTFQQKYGVYQQNMRKYQDYASAILLGQVNNILKVISDAGGYDLVLTSNQLVYAKPKYDLTDQVIEKLKKVDSDTMVKQLSNADKEAPGQLR
jgi:outer membrane protein